MKKLLLTGIAALGLAASASAQLAEGSLFPFPGGATGGLTAVNAPFAGTTYNLDSLSNAGYTIFIDISATWCPPCWAYHNEKQLDSLWYYHGPTGMSGVSATTTNDVFVLFFQGETTSHLAELNGDYAAGAIPYTTTELPYATVTQGNWVTGTPFPMIDDTTSTASSYGTNVIDAAWHISFFPTIYMVCRDHLVHNLTQPSYTAAYAAAQAECPTYAPSPTIDAKATTYSGSAYYICNAAPAVTFQNYSQTATITTATITATDATGATVATFPWTGSLAPYALTTVTIPSFAGTSFGGYKYSVSVPGDSYAANNTSADSVFKIYNVANADAIPETETFQADLSYKETISSPDGYGETGYLTTTQVGADGTTASSASFVVLTPYTSAGVTEEYIFGNFNTSGAPSPTVSFDVSYAPFSSSSTDKLTVKTSTDCGATWTTVYSKSGATLATAPANNSSFFIPTSADVWRHEVVSLGTAGTAANTMVKFDFVTGGGNDFFLDNVNISAVPSAVPQVFAGNDISIVPNPAKDMAYVELTLTEAATVHVELIDALGRVFSTVSQDFSAGDQKIALSTADVASGLYYVKIVAGGTTTTKALSVVK